MKRSLLLLAVVWLLGACAVEMPGAPPSVEIERENFQSVSLMLGVRCGSLDCHGNGARPLRLYHEWGLRLDPEDVSGSGRTRSEEHEANLRAIWSLEPELLLQVVAEGGRGPDRLTLVRKATALESHKGNAVLVPGDDGFLCLLSWLRSEVDVEKCERAAQFERPE